MSQVFLESYSYASQYFEELDTNRRVFQRLEILGKLYKEYRSSTKPSTSSTGHPSLPTIEYIRALHPFMITSGDLTNLALKLRRPSVPETYLPLAWAGFGVTLEQRKQSQCQWAVQTAVSQAVPPDWYFLDRPTNEFR